MYGVPLSPLRFFKPDSGRGFVPKEPSETSSDSGSGYTGVTTTDSFRSSLSSALSSSSRSSFQDDRDALNDVFIWGQGIGDGVLGGGVYRVGNSTDPKIDTFLPKALESAIELDVHNIDCGGWHAALVTKQGEVFSWGEESGGRLGHGVDADVSQPKLVGALANTNVELVACGEYHTCAVTLSGDLYTWGDGTHNFGLLGHGKKMSQWVPKKVNGPLEGIHVSSVSCGPWHTAVVTLGGQLFTFGDGTFGVLGHGDRKSAASPREVESLKGLKTVRAACGVWHTAAVVEVTVRSSRSSNCSSGKLFTWGDGDTGMLGQGDKNSRLVPTCVAALVEPNFRQVACGHSLTVALTTSGHVYTMGSAVNGQLGNPQADGKLPVRVEGKLRNEFVHDIACGAYHVAVLTSKSEVYTWGKGANGRLGHGDIEDRNSPTLVEALKDKQVKSVACGSSFTAAICLNKWVSGADQSMCSGCQLPFGFIRKRHNCYNCGLVFCHACSAKKSFQVSLAPNINKRFRVCDNCYIKLKAIEAGLTYNNLGIRRGSVSQHSYDSEEKQEKFDAKSPLRFSRFSNVESSKQTVSRYAFRRNRKTEFHGGRVSPVPNGNTPWGNTNITVPVSPLFGSSKTSPLPVSRIVSRASSPISRRPRPPRCSTPTPKISDFTSPKLLVDDEKKANDTLSQGDEPEWLINYLKNVNI